jgi:hypothetical protein
MRVDREEKEMSSTFYGWAGNAMSEGSKGNVLVRHHFRGYRSVADALELAEEARAKLRSGGIEFTDQGNSSIGIEFSEEKWQFGLLQVNLQIKMKLPPKEARRALQEAGFSSDLKPLFSL